MRAGPWSNGTRPCKNEGEIPEFALSEIISPHEITARCGWPSASQEDNAHQNQ